MLTPAEVAELDQDHAEAQEHLDRYVAMVRDWIAQYGTHGAAARIVQVIDGDRPETAVAIALSALLRLGSQEAS